MLLLKFRVAMIFGCCCFWNESIKADTPHTIVRKLRQILDLITAFFPSEANE